jgi:hypothetical protein
MNRKDMSPRTMARVIGALYLVTIVAGVFAQGFISGQLIVSNDAGATASPPLGMRLFPFIAAVGLLGSLVTIGWLLVVGVDEPRWRERAGAWSLQ